MSLPTKEKNRAQGNVYWSGKPSAPVSKGMIKGWAFDGKRKATIDVHVDGKRIGTCRCTITRSNLLDVPVEERENGFSFTLPEKFCDGKPHRVSVCLGGTATPLTGGDFTVALTKDGTVLHADAPSAAAGKPKPSAAAKPSGKAKTLAADTPLARLLTAGMGFSEAKDWTQAAAAFEAAIVIDPANIEAHARLGLARIKMKMREQAIAPLQFALQAKPNNVAWRKALIRCLMSTQQFDEAMANIDMLLPANPDDFDLRYWLAQCLEEMHDWPSALAAAEAALVFAPDNQRLRRLLAKLNLHVGDLTGALSHAEAAIAIDDADARSHQFKGDVLVRLVRFEEAVGCYERALNLAPEDSLTRNRLGSVKLLLGQFEEAFEFQEGRRTTPTFLKLNRTYPQTQWDGELDIPGKLLVWCEAGFGVGQNLLQTCFIPMLSALGIKVVLEIEARLVPLYERSFPDVEIVALGVDAMDPRLCEPDISHQIPIGSLARLLRPQAWAFGNAAPYLTPDADKVAELRRTLRRIARGRSSDLLVGISWTSANPYVGNEKSIELRNLLRALDIPGVRLVNLQYGDHSAVIEQATREIGIDFIQVPGIDTTNALDDLAALIAALDLVVCIGHTTAHLAGAVGVPNFIMVPASPFAHWLARGEACIWYPMARIFRQSAEDPDWDTVLGHVHNAVCAFQEGYRSETAWLANTLLRDGPIQARGRDKAFVLAAAAETQDRLGRPHAAAENMRRAVALDGAHNPAYMERLAALLATIGLWEEAAEWYGRCLERSPDSVPLLSQLTAVCIDQFRLPEAAGLLDRLRALEPSAIGWPLLQGNLCLRLDDVARAHAACSAALAIAPENGEAALLAGRIAMRREDLEDAKAMFQKASDTEETGAEGFYQLGLALMAQGHLGRAIPSFSAALAHNKARQMTPNPAAAFYRRQCLESLEYFGDIPPKNPLPSLPPMEGILPEPQPDDTVVFFVADNAYFWKHAIPLAFSIDANAPGSFCHIHVINPDAKVATAVSLLKATLTNITLSVTTETIDLSGRPKGFARTYFACVRFVRLYQIMADMPAHYLCVDSDCLVLGPLDGLKTEIGDADLMIRQRYDHRPYLTVAAGGLYLRPTAGALGYVRAVADLIRTDLLAGGSVWFLDQVVLSHVLDAQTRAGRIRAAQLNMRYIDWFFRSDSVIWTGKGKRKTNDTTYLGTLSRYNQWTGIPALVDEMWRRRTGDGGRPGLKVLVLQPKLTVPFGQTPLASRYTFEDHRKIGDLRSSWGLFAQGAADALARRGHAVVHLEIPNWQITADFIALCRPDLAFVPHRQSFELKVPKVRILYYMQVFFHWMFTVDRQGWGAGSSQYPCDAYIDGDGFSPVYRTYVQTIVENNISKFDQPPRLGRSALEEQGIIPADDYIFFPCQIPTDQSIRYFSPLSLADVVTAVANWANERGIHVVFKQHPLDRGKSGFLSQSVTGPYVRWVNASVHDLIAHAKAVYVVNSGVGLEAALHGKPVVTFGRVEYDRVTVRATLNDLDGAWNAVISRHPGAVKMDYARFFDWLSRTYAVDLKFDPNLPSRFDRLAIEAEAVCEWVPPAEPAPEDAPLAFAAQ